LTDPLNRGLKGIRGTKRRANAFEARRYVRAMQATTPCAMCKRYSKRRVGELAPRRPLDWYPMDGRPRRVESMIYEGRTVEEIKREMEKCLPLCRPCSKKVLK